MLHFKSKCSVRFLLAFLEIKDKSSKRQGLRNKLKTNGFPQPNPPHRNLGGVYTPLYIFPRGDQPIEKPLEMPDWNLLCLQRKWSVCLYFYFTGSDLLLDDLLFHFSSLICKMKTSLGLSGKAC